MLTAIAPTYRLFVGGVLVVETTSYITLVETADDYMPCIRAGVRAVMLIVVDDDTTENHTREFLDTLIMEASE